VGFQPSFAALGDALATADLWLPVDDLAGAPGDMPQPERHGEERSTPG
jgi:hypothetical protein